MVSVVVWPVRVVTTAVKSSCTSCSFCAVACRFLLPIWGVIGELDVISGAS